MTLIDIGCSLMIKFYSCDLCISTNSWAYSIVLSTDLAFVLLVKVFLVLHH